MRRFLYYLPGCAKAVVTHQDLRAAGLGYAVDGPSGWECRPISAGPDGGAGLILVPPAADAPQGLYEPSQQAWRKGPGGESGPLYWVGMYQANPPGPHDLVRRRVIEGEAVVLLDGREWIIPRARSIARGSTLPRRLVLGVDCQSWSLTELPEFVEICADAEKVWQAFIHPKKMEDGRTAVELESLEVIRIAINAMAVNHRVSPVEVDLLGLLSTEGVWAILRALIDAPELERLALASQKKRAPSDTSPICDGAAAS